MNAIEIIDKLNDAKSAKAKDIILEAAWYAECFDFFKGINKGLDPFAKMAITKIPLITEEDDEPDELGIDKLLILYETLKNHTLVGNTASGAIDNALNISSVHAWNNWYRRILLKDFQKTVSAIQINRALNKISKKDARAIKYLIPTISYQKHTIYKNDLLAGQVFIDSFIEGERLIIILDKDSKQVMYFNAKGKLLESDKRFNKLMEVMPFGIMMDTVKCNKRINITDIMPLDEYKKGYSHRDQEQRHGGLVEIRDFVFSLFGQDVVIHPKIKVDLNNSENLKKIEEDFKMQGMSCIMIKDVQQHYLTKKTKNWLKYSLDI